MTGENQQVVVPMTDAGVRYEFDDVASQADAAYRKGAKVTDNPYPVGHKMHVMWQACYQVCESNHSFWSQTSVSVAAPIPRKKRKKWTRRTVPMNEKREIEARIAAHGYTLRYVDYCEDARTPGFLGQIRGVTDHERKEVKISRMANRTDAEMLDILQHELRHLDEPDWDCGNRDVIGRGGKQ